MKKTEMFSTKVTDLNFHDHQPFDHAVVGWVLETAIDKDCVRGFSIKIITIDAYTEESNKSEKVPVSSYKIDTVIDYCFGFDRDLKPRSMVFHNGDKIQISF